MRWWPLTARGTGAAVLAVAALVLAGVLRVVELVHVGVLLAVLLALSLAVVVLARGSERLTRHVRPDAPRVGDAIGVHLDLSVRRALPQTPGKWSDTVPAAFEGTASGVLPALPAALGGRRSHAEPQYEVRAVRRGRHRLGPLWIVSTDPFGLVRRVRSVGSPTPVTVAPAVVALSALTQRPADAAGSMHSTSNALGQGTDNLVPRAYLPGDSMRRIHWRASAHRDDLMVRQEEQETAPEATVVLDLSRSRWAAAAATPGVDPAFERAVSATASTTVHLLQEGYRVRVIDASGAELAGALDADDLAARERFVTGCATLGVGDDAAWSTLAVAAGSEALGPFVLVAGALSPADADALSTLAQTSSYPVLLCAHPGEGALTVAARAGWRTGALSGEVAQAWEHAVSGAPEVGRRP